MFLKCVYMQVNPRAKKVKEKIVPKVVVRNVMFKRKATKVSIGGTEEQARKNKKDMISAVRTAFMKMELRALHHLTLSGKGDP